ncbi:MAG: type II secretion system F family protein [Gemmataceae bacterium]
MLPLIFVFLAVSAVSFLLFQWSASRGRRVQERLPKDMTDAERPMVFGPLTPAIAAPSPVLGEANRESLQQELRAAGYYQPTALVEYRAIRVVLIFAPVVTALVLALLVDRTYMTSILIAGGVLAILGYSLPRIYLNYSGAMRLNGIRRGLPVAVDLITLGLSAGQNMLASLQRVSRELRFAFPDLANELDIVLRQASLNTLPHAFEQFADRVNIQEVRSLAVLLRQVERVGADISAALLEFSASLRTTLRHRAEAQANRASFWMLFPSLLCLWIPAGIILLGPIFFEFRATRERNRDVLQANPDAIRKATDSSDTTPKAVESEER